MQLFGDFADLEDFGAFDDVVSGNVRDPYTELARMRREEPIQRIDISGMPGEEGKPVFIVYRHEDITAMLKDNETFSSAIVIMAYGDVLGRQVMLGLVTSFSVTVRVQDAVLPLPSLAVSVTVSTSLWPMSTVLEAGLCVTTGLGLQLSLSVTAE